LDGKCDRNGIQFNVFSKNDTTDEDFILTDEQQDRINVLAKRVCLDPNDMQLQSGNAIQIQQYIFNNVEQS
jgi:hypothetical protein